MASREERKKRITRQRQGQILEAALLVFSRRGFNGATIPEIAHEAGVAVGTIYNYYQNKRDLLVAITNKYVIEPFTEIIKQSRAVGDAAYMAAIMENRLSFSLENIGKLLPLFNEVQRDTELRRNYAEQVVWPIMGIMEKYVASRVKEGVFRDINPALVTRAVGGMVIGFMLLYRIEGAESPIHSINRKKLADELAGLVLKGLQRR